MEKNKLNFIVSFFYSVYLISIINDVYVVGIKPFLINANSFFITFGIILFILTFVSQKVTPKNPTLFRLIKEDYFIFFNSIMLAHVIYFFRVFEKLTDFISSSLKFNHEIITSLIFILIFSLVAYTIPKIPKRRLLIFTSVIFFLQVLYQSIFFISFKNQAFLYEETYISFAKNDIRAKECGKLIDCDKIMPKDLSKVIQIIIGSLPKDSNGEAIANYFLNFEKEIQNTDDETVSFSYTSKPWKFASQQYKPIGVYNKNTGLLIIDTKSNHTIKEYHDSIRQQLTGSSIIIWFLFSFFLIVLHGKVKSSYGKKQNSV